MRRKVTSSHCRSAAVMLMATLVVAACTASTLAQEPLRVRRNIFGMHNLKDGGPAFDVGMEWTKHMAGPGFVFDWVTDPVPWIEKAFQLGLIPCIRVQECNGGCTPNPGYAGNMAWAILNYKLANPQYADRMVYLQLWNEPSDPRDSVPPDVYANYLVAAHNAVHAAENQAAQQNPNVAGTFKTMTPGQNGPSWWTQAVTANPNCKLAFDVWGTHPYPEAGPPHYNLHDGDIYIETSKSIDSYLMDLDVIASPHGNPPVSRRGFPVMVTETAYGDHLGISYEGWPKTNRQMAADYNVDAFGERWYKWPEVIAAHPFILCNWSWEAFAFVHGGSGSIDSNGDGVDEPTDPYPQYTAVRDLRVALEGTPPSGRSMAPARLTPYRGAVGSISGTVTRSGAGTAVKYATIYTDGYEFGNVSLYDGGYAVYDVPVGTYTLTCTKNGYVSASQQITVTSGQNTTANFSLVYQGKVSKGFYFVDTFNGDCGCSGCNLSATYLGQTFTTPSDVRWIKYVACKPNVDNVTIRFTIRQGANPNGTQIGSAITATLEPGVGGNMIGAEWPDGQEPAVSGNTVYTLRVERTDGLSQYCYASNCNPYAGGNMWVGTTSQSSYDMYSCMRGLTEQVFTATGTIAGTVKDTSNNPLSGALVATDMGGYSATTNGSGQYTISNVAVGTYDVTASKAGYVSQTSYGQQVMQNQTTTINFNLTPGASTGTISGTVKDTSSNPLSGATVQTTTGGYSTTTNASGQYTLSNVTPGTYTVEASKTGYQDGIQSGVTVTAGQTTTLNFNLAPIPPFSGVVNGNFEGGSFNEPDVDHKTANSWHRFIVSGSPKHDVPWLGSNAHSPNYVQNFYEASYTAGIYQQVAGTVAAGQYTASVWVKKNAGTVYFRVGIDPAGGTDATSANVQWCTEVTGTSSWQQISKQVTATSSTVTVFIRARNPNGTNGEAWFDDAVLTQDSVPSGPAIVRSPTTLAPSCYQGYNATSEAFIVQNGGSGTLSYSISDNVGWLSCSPSSGTSTGEQDTITVTYSTSGLSPGTYNGTITISDPNASNNPQTIAVTLTVVSLTPTIGRSPATLSPSCTVGNNASNQTFTVQNTGGGTLSYSMTDDVTWLSCSPASGTSTGEADTITVSYTTSGLSAGTYYATITISDPYASNNPQTIAVTLTVSSLPFSGLANGNFEGGFYNAPDVDHKVANSWTKFIVAGSPKHAGDWSPTNHSPNWSQVFYEATWTAGIYQQATNAVFGSTYTASVWVKGENTSLNFWIGVDPTGGTNAASGNVQWSSVSTPGATWTKIQKQVTASAPTITVFVKAQNTAGASRSAWIDDAACVNP